MCMFTEIQYDKLNQVLLVENRGDFIGPAHHPFGMATVVRQRRGAHHEQLTTTSLKHKHLKDEAHMKKKYMSPLGFLSK